MSALRIHYPGQPVALWDEGPCPANSVSVPAGVIARPAATKYREDTSAADRVRRFRARHGGRKAVAA